LSRWRARALCGHPLKSHIGLLDHLVGGD